MTDGASREEDPEEKGPPKTPFDNPLFLPVLLWIFAVWFGYDGWINTDEHMLESGTLWFNRIGFPVVALAALWFTVRGIRERREEREKGGSA